MPERSRAAVRPVAVTGIGIQSPLGQTAKEHWARIAAGERAVRLIHPSEFPAETLDYGGWTTWSGAPFAAASNRCRPGTEFLGPALQTVIEARRHAGLDHGSHPVREPGGVVFGASKPFLEGWANQPPQSREGQSSRAGGSVPGKWAGMFPMSAAASAIAAAYQCEGPLVTPSAACATGLLSVIQATTWIREGVVERVIAGSADSSLHPAYLAAYRRMGVLAPPGAEAGRSCRPFDVQRSGFAVGEGAASLILEDLELARSRGAPVLAELHGFGLTSDNDSLVEADPSGHSLARAILDALERSAIGPGEIDAISLHGTGTRLNDLCETRAIKAVFGSHARDISCFSLKGAIGHLMGAAGSVETATLIQAMLAGVVPPTVNLETPDPACDLDYTPQAARRRRLQTTLKVSMGFGGTCAALVIRRPQPR